MQNIYGNIILPLALDQSFTYKLDNSDIKIGSFARLNFRNKEYIGIVLSIDNQPPSHVDIGKIKTAYHITQLQPLTPAQIKFMQWLAHYYAMNLGLMIKAMLGPKQLWQHHLQSQSYIALSDDYQHHYQRKTAKRDAVINCLKQNHDMRIDDVMDQTNILRATINTMVKQQILRLYQQQSLSQNIHENETYQYRDFTLTSEQQQICDDYSNLITQQKFAVALLDGETGAGKSETYFHAIAKALGIGKNILILMPEIALLSQWSDNFKKRFGTMAPQWHSGLSPSQRRHIWQRANHGNLRILAGARSALHVPLDNIGLIIIDEEHERSFKQEEGLLYHARDAAIMRAKLSDCPIILVSATPALESYTHAIQRKYHYHQLSRRADQSSMPNIHIIDMVNEKLPSQRWISPTLQNALSLCLQQKQQAMLFLNRRGYAPLLLCRSCGHRFACASCESWLVIHQRTKKITCHHCGHQEPIPQSCPSCGNDNLHAYGPGVERIFEEASQYFPEANIAIMTSDHIVSVDDFKQFIDDIQQRAIDIVVATQILAKGMHFKQLQTVGIIDADMALQGGDFRAGEHCYQLLHQLAGRAGREQQRGDVFIQTYHHDHHIMQALKTGERNTYLTAEMQYRKAHYLPPFGQVAALIIAASSLDICHHACHILCKNMPNIAHVKILGPAPASLAFVRQKHRQRFLILSQKRDMNLGQKLQQWVKNSKLPDYVKITIDIDPQSFL